MPHILHFLSTLTNKKQNSLSYMSTPGLFSLLLSCTSLSSLLVSSHIYTDQYSARVTPLQISGSLPFHVRTSYLVFGPVYSFLLKFARWPTSSGYPLPAKLLPNNKVRKLQALLSLLSFTLLSVQCLKIIISTIVSCFLPVLDKRVNLVPITPPCPRAEVPQTLKNSLIFHEVMYHNLLNHYLTTVYLDIFTFSLINKGYNKYLCT